MDGKKMCPLLTAGYWGNEQSGADWINCVGDDCQLWWFCSGKLGREECINVDAHVQNNY